MGMMDSQHGNKSEGAASSGRRYGLRKAACYEKRSLKAKKSHVYFDRRQDLP